MQQRLLSCLAMRYLTFLVQVCIMHTRLQTWERSGLKSQTCKYLLKYHTLQAAKLHNTIVPKCIPEISVATFVIQTFKTAGGAKNYLLLVCKK